MSVLMKKRPTEIVSIGNERFKVPKETAKAVLVLLKSKFEEKMLSFLMNLIRLDLLMKDSVVRVLVFKVRELKKD